MKRQRADWLYLTAIARSVDHTFAAVLVLSVLAGLACSQLELRLLTQNETISYDQVINRAAIVGLALPIAVLGRTLEDRFALYAVAGSRRSWPRRIMWLAILALGTLVVAAITAAVLPPSQRTLVIVDGVTLLSFAVISAVLFGAGLSWCLPIGLAMTMSTPGAVPLRWNFLVNVDLLGRATVVAVVSAVVSTVAYAWLDDFGLSWRRRLYGRVASVNND